VPVQEVYHWTVNLVGVSIRGIDLQVETLDAVIDSGSSLNFVPLVYAEYFFAVLLRNVAYNTNGEYYFCYCSERIHMKPV